MLDDVGSRNIILDQGTTPLSDRSRRSLYVYPKILAEKVRATALSRTMSDPWTRNKCSFLMKSADDLGLSRTSIPSARSMLAKQYAIFAISDHFQRIIDKTRAESVLQVCYYSVVGFAMNLAGQKMGVPVTDVQHGVIGHYHLAYAQWALKLEEGDLLPDRFWTWSKLEASVINETNSHGRKALDLGHPMVAAWRAGRISGAQDARAHAEEIRARRPVARHVLYTLQPGLSNREHLSALATTMSRSKNCFWWIRLHPATVQDFDSIRLILERTGVEFNITDATELPLYSVLEVADLHVTHSSSVTIEAAEFGVKTIITSAYGADYFSHLIEDGSAEYKGDIESLISAINAAA